MDDLQDMLAAPQNNHWGLLPVILIVIVGTWGIWKKTKAEDDD